MLFGSFYRSRTPTVTSDVNNENLNKLLTLISSKGYQCLVGDYNFKDINWISWTTSRNDESKEFKFIETVRDCHLHQHKIHVDVGTTSLGILIISSLTKHSPLGKSDHDMITFNFNCYLDYSKPKERYAYHKTDYSATRRYLEETK